MIQDPMMRSLLPFLVAAGAFGCATREPAPRTAGPLLVAVPASLRAAFDQIARAYQARRPEAAITLTTAAPDELLRAGAPLDVIAAESPEALAALAPRLLERREYASNPLVLVARAGAPKLALASLPPAVHKIAIGDGRSDPTGAAAEAALGRLGLRRALDARLDYVPRSELALARVAEGKDDAAIVRASELAGLGGLQIAERLAGGDPRYPIAIVAGTPRLTAAREFLEEVLHGDGPRALAAAGLQPSAAP